MTDSQHIHRIRQALRKLVAARNYSTQAARMVREAEQELKRAMEKAQTPDKPTGDGEQVAA